MIKSLFASSLAKPNNTGFEGEDQDEKIQYVFRRSFITNFDWIFTFVVLLMVPYTVGWILSLGDQAYLNTLPTSLLTILTIFWYMFTLAFAFQHFLHWYFNVYIITDKRIVDIDFTNLLFQNISEAPLVNIEDVTSNVRGFLRVVFHYGNVQIQTAANEKEFEFTDVQNPNYVRDILSDIVTNLANSGQGARN